MEELAWRIAARPSETWALLAAMSGVIALAMVIVLLARSVMRGFLPVALAVLPAAFLSIHHVLRYRYLEEPAAALVALPLSLALAVVIAVIARRRIARLVLLPCVAAPWLVPTAVRYEHPVPARAFPDVILIVMDTTRRDHLSLYGYARSTSPNLEAVARDAEVYEDAWSVAPWTPPSHASMLTGLLPARHRVDGQATPPFPAGLTTLPGVLRRAGYVTGGFVANPELAEKGWARDFDDYRVPWYRGRHALILLLNRWREGSEDPWRTPFSSARTLELARRFWESHQGRPRFVFINLLDPHRPYNSQPKGGPSFLGEDDLRLAQRVDQNPISYHVKPGLSPQDARLLAGLYDGEIAAMDREIGAFLQWLRARGELDRALLVMTADHGERLGERGLVGHDLVMDPTLLRVPLLVRYKPVVAPARTLRRVQTDGLAATILELAGIPAPASMAPPLDRQQRPVVVAQYQDPAWYVQKLKQRDPGFDGRPYAGDWTFAANQDFALVCSPNHAASSACLLNDLRHDPDWTRDVKEQQPEVWRELKGVADALPSFGRVEPHRADPELLERLRTLGYVD